MKDEQVPGFQPHECMARDDKMVVIGHAAWGVERSDCSDCSNRTSEIGQAEVFTLRKGKIARLGSLPTPPQTRIGAEAKLIPFCACRPAHVKIRAGCAGSPLSQKPTHLQAACIIVTIDVHTL